ncbi:MAG: VOC family protein [Pseudomonadales bacterium]
MKNLDESKSFYTKLGFLPVFGDETQGWLVLSNENCKIGLFQNMFDENMLTFNPGWNSSGEKLSEFEDIRALQQKMKEQGMALLSEADASTNGPASLMIKDPDGNLILIDQHV